MRNTMPEPNTPDTHDEPSRSCRSRAKWISLGLALCLAWGSAVSPAHALPKSKKKKAAEAAANRVPFQDSGEWEGFFKDEEGYPYELLTPIERNTDDDWMTLEFTEFTGNRSRIAIWRVADKIGMHTTEGHNGFAFWQYVYRSSVAPLQAIEDMLTSSIFNTNRFEVVERKDIETVLAEQDFGATERVTVQSAAQIGRTLGADYILFSSINEWTPKKKKRGIPGIGKSIAEVALSIRVVDTETAEVAFAGTFRGTSRNRSIRLPFFGQQDISPVNYALTACLNKAVYEFATDIKVRPWRGAVVDISGDLVILNGGENRGVTKGQIFRAVRKGKEMIDPESGKSLGYRQEVIGTLKVTTVDPLMATAVITEGCKGLKVGDFVRPEEGSGSSP